MAGYYRKFVLKFAQITKPLYELTSPKNRFLWSAEHENAFKTLKKVLSEAPVLAQPNIEKARDGSRPFVIYTDASRVGLGAVLAQQGEDGLIHPVFFASKSLTQAERNYHVTDQEALAMVYALKKFHYFIYGVRTIVRTDHAALTSLFKRTNVSPRVLRWALEVQRYDLTIEHVKGSANCVADALSRGIPQNACAARGDAEDEKVVCAVQESEWLAELRQDPYFSPVISAIENKRDEEVKLPRHEKLLSSADFLIEGGKLKLIREDGSAVSVVPQSRRRELFDESHSGVLGGHFHARKMFRTLRKVVFWPGMYQDLVSWCRSCQQCFLTNRNTENIPPLRPITVSRPFQIVGVDLLEMGLTTCGNRYIVTVIDHFTKYLGAYPVANKKAETVAEALFSNWVCGAGRWPEVLLSDRGSEFENEVMAVLCQIMGIEQKFTKGYCPRENGLTERVNGTIVRMLKKKTTVPAEWDKILPTIVYAYNASEHRATGESPHFLVYGRDPRYPSAVIPSDQLSPYIVDYDKYKTELLCGLKLAQEVISENSKEYREKMKENYDRRLKTSRSTIFTAGDRVYMKLPAEKGKSRHPKLVTDWSGPFRVIEASNNSALVTLIGENQEPHRVQFDHLVKIPSEIDDTPLSGTVTRRKRGRREILAIQEGNLGGVIKTSFDNFSNFSAPLSSADNVRHVDWICPGQLTLNGQSVQCSLETTIRDVIQNAPLSSFSFKSPYELARIIAVITQSHTPDNWRISRMLDSSYDILTVSSLGMAISYYRSHCIHCTLASVADAGNSMILCPPRSHNDPYHLPHLFPKAVDFANRNPWTSASWTLLKPRKTLVLLPEGFDETLRCFESEMMLAKVMHNPEDVDPNWFEEELSAVVVFSPASYWSALRWRTPWVLFIQAVAQGAELIALPGPQDDETWGKSVDMLRDLMEETAAQRPSLAKRLRCLLPLKSEDNRIGAAFKILADKINLVTGRHFTQSAAKRFWTATMAQYSAFVRLPECKRVRNVSENNENTNIAVGNSVRGRQDSVPHSRLYARGRGVRHEGFQRRRSFSQHRPHQEMERGDFPRRSFRGRWNRF
ncbi:hypothetical protein Y032_0170g268 [Ancylostoma ceylanicum]|nr:hypothetical protein Y032_0170g268 [Ancylostoma ceylanicum]